MAIEQKNQNDGQSNEQEGPEFGIQRVYVKDLSFEAPNTPAIFLENWEPEMSLDLGTKTESLGDDVHEVILTVTVTVKVGEKTEIGRASCRERV